MNMKTAAKACVFLATLFLSSDLCALEIPVIVREPAGIARKAEPVSGGIPLPDGVFKPAHVDLALYDGDRPVGAQIVEHVVGPGGFVRWVLLDFQLDLKANENKTLILKEGAAVGPDVELKVQDSTASVRVDTGELVFHISRNEPFCFLQDVSVKGRLVMAKGRVSYIDGLTNKEYTADTPQLVKVHYAGPLRATIEVRGKFRDDRTARLGYCTYITAWANRSDILVRHSLINSREDQRYVVQVKGSRIELKPLDASGGVLVGADKTLTAQSGMTITLHQGLEERRNRSLPSGKAVQDGRTIWEGRGAQGWISNGSIWAADRLFRTDPPRSVGVGEDGTLILDAAPALFEGQKTNSTITGRPWACQDGYRWLYDCSHLSSEYRIDFDAPQNSDQLQARAQAAAARVWAFAPGAWYSRCNVLGVGRFGTVEDEAACHAKWNWTAGSPPDRKPDPDRFVGYEDNHYESESDSAEALLLMFLRTGKRGFFDEAEGWVRYHTDLQAWRTEGWAWKDGGIWWPQGGPPGNRPVRGKIDRDFEKWNKGTDADRTLWRLAMAKGCYCHFYGAGLVDWYCLTGDREALLAAVDDCETKWDEFTRYRNFQPGESNLGSTRGFGRGFYVAVRTWMVQPENPMLQKLVKLCRDTLVSLPDKYLDERGVYAVTSNKRPERYLTDGIGAYMSREGITVDQRGNFRDRSGNQWQWRDIGGTWMIAYIQHACNLLAEQADDEDLMDYVIASGHFTAKYMLSPVAKQTWYYTALDIPRKGEIWDNWKYDGQTRNEFGEGPRQSGWYTRFFPDCCVRAFSWTGQRLLLDKGREFWSFGNRRRYQTTELTKTHHFANHIPPKDDSVLSTVRLFHESIHPRQDREPPEAVDDLTVRLLGQGAASVRFSAPSDEQGRVIKYQVKVSPLPIVPYEQWEYSRDSSRKRNWWRAVNCKGEANPKAPGAVEEFVITNVPDSDNGPLYFAVRSFDDSQNRSRISNVFRVK